jgi:hypothetical protein
MELLQENGSAVKASKRGKIISVWVEKLPSKLFVNRDYLLPNFEGSLESFSEDSSDWVFV